ncbi:ankyrin [Raccoonpox virus]|uniref:Ankyrin repeat-containing protein n=1 Tax=Raccoon poxvirus TaxID=10256 RepID=A0A0G3G2D2_RACVI|nr:Ankyrin repeat-containing protein [Raccoonpox virus]YP_009143518.1 Ankyrin repeat-containing protein [Raccoonpox virus]AKJ93637.1 Ankyrin repeat-containing protein [Raccoonpox virus]AKJ93839.1 Ankyrin repeat-containing protein [Raccoonpox virus]AOP31475.1 ankyrin [Raccoonpox virus]
MDEIVSTVRDNMWYIPDTYLRDDADRITINNVYHMYLSLFDVIPSSHLFKLTLKHCDLNKRLRCGISPLHCYLVNPRFRPSVLKILLHHGMKNFDSVDYSGRIPVHYYMMHADRIDNKIFDILTDGISFRKHNDLLLYYLRYNYGKDLNYYVLYKLVTEGSDPNCVDKDGLTPLHFYCRYVSAFHERNYYASKPYTKMNAEKRFINTIVKYGADINAVTVIGNTPLHTYLREYTRHRPRVVYTLLSLGADTRIRNIYGYTPIMEYIKCDYASSYILIMLLKWHEQKYGKIQKEDGQHIVHLFIKHNRGHDLNILAYLLDKFNIHVDEYYDTMTPLHVAYRNCNSRIAAYLVYIGYDINLPTKDGKTVTDLIFENPSIIFKADIVNDIIKHRLKVSLSIIKSLLDRLADFASYDDYYLKKIIAYCVLRDVTFVERYRKYCSNPEYRGRFIKNISFDVVDSIITKCSNEISRLKDIRLGDVDLYTVLRTDDIRYYSHIQNIYSNRYISFPMYDIIIEECYISMINKNRLINDAMNKIQSIIDDKSMLSKLPPEILHEIISKLSDYNINNMLYGKKHYKYHH